MPVPDDMSMATTTTSITDDIVVKFPATLVHQLLDAFESCSDDICERPEYTIVRTKVFSEALMYSRHIHPRSLRAVVHLRSIMQRFQEMESVEDFIEESPSILEDCDNYREEAEGLIEQHAKVLGNLKKLKNDINREWAYMEESVADILKSSEKHIKEAKKLRAAGRFAAIIPSFAGKIKDEAEHKVELAHKQLRDAATLDEAVKSFETLLICHSILYKVISVLAHALNRMVTEMYTVLSAGKSVQTPSDAAERGFKGLKNAAIRVIEQSDIFLETRVKYPETMGAIGAEELLTTEFERDWKEQLNITL